MILHGGFVEFFCVSERSKYFAILSANGVVKSSAIAWGTFFFFSHRYKTC
jgi:hypothetical protein